MRKEGTSYRNIMENFMGQSKKVATKCIKSAINLGFELDSQTYLIWMLSVDFMMHFNSASKVRGPFKEL